MLDSVTGEPITRFDLFCELGKVRRRLRILGGALLLSPLQYAERLALEVREAELVRRLDEMGRAS